MINSIIVNMIHLVVIFSLFIIVTSMEKFTVAFGIPTALMHEEISFVLHGKDGENNGKPLDHSDKVQHWDILVLHHIVFDTFFSIL